MTGVSSCQSLLVGNERLKFMNTISTNQFIQYIQLIPCDMYDIYGEVKYSFRLKKILSKVIWVIVRIYSLMRKVGLIK
jgi:hypothetical protein